MEGQHAVLSPSGADRWMVCPGSVRLSEGMPDTSSKAADEGTAAHFMAAECLIAKVDAIVHLGKTINVVVNLKSFKVKYNFLFIHLISGTVLVMNVNLKNKADKHDSKNRFV